MILLLENVRSILNVGGIFRLADAVAAEKILIVGCTPCPIDRMGRKNEKMHKTALGAEDTVPWHYYQTTEDALADAPESTPIAVEQTPRAISYTDFPEPTNPIFIFGSETDGITPDTLNKAAHHISIPMRGTKESLNITTCAAVVLYHFINSESKN